MLSLGRGFRHGDAEADPPCGGRKPFLFNGCSPTWQKNTPQLRTFMKHVKHIILEEGPPSGELGQTISLSLTAHFSWARKSWDQTKGANSVMCGLRWYRYGCQLGASDALFVVLPFGSWAWQGFCVRGGSLRSSVEAQGTPKWRTIWSNCVILLARLSVCWCAFVDQRFFFDLLRILDPNCIKNRSFMQMPGLPEV